MVGKVTTENIYIFDQQHKRGNRNISDRYMTAILTLIIW